jgi:hypothetical protein
MNLATKAGSIHAALAGLFCLGLGHAPAIAQDAPALAPSGDIEIQQLVNRLNFAVDYCGNGGADFADLFVAGGGTFLQGSIPMIKPPYDRITAYDMNTGEMLWQKPHSTTPDSGSSAR